MERSRAGKRYIPMKPRKGTDRLENVSEGAGLGILSVAEDVR